MYYHERCKSLPYKYVHVGVHASIIKHTNKSIKQEVGSFNIIRLQQISMMMNDKYFLPYL